MELFVQLIINGIIIGAVYSLASLGYALTLKLNINNFAHGSVVMLGSFLGYLALRMFHLPLYLTLIFISSAGTIIGLFIYFVGVKPVLRYNNWTLIIASTFGISLLFSNLILIFHGFNLFSIRDLFYPKILNELGFTITNIQIILIVASILLFFLLHVIINKTNIGIKFLAVSEDKEAASTMGINSNVILMEVLVIASVLAVLSGFLISFDYDQNATVGISFLIISYTATIIGGVHNLVKVFFAAYILGIVESLITGYISSQYMLASAFFVLIIFFLFKKEGLNKIIIKREV